MSKWYEIKALKNSAEISIYDEIGGWGVSAKDFVEDLKGVGDVADITLRLNSPGGSVFDGMAIYNQIKQHKAQVTVYIDGLAASMASVIAMAGDLVIMPENAMMMIHNPWTMAVGDAEDLRNNADLLDKIKSTMLSAYAKKSGKSEDEISAIMDAETWLTGAEALEAGFADEAEPALDIAASIKDFDLSKFQNAPLLVHGQSMKVPLEGARMLTENETVLYPSAVADTTNEESSMTTENTATPAVDSQAVDQAVNAGLAKEETRRAEIVAAFGDYAKDHGELLTKCLLDSKVSVADAQAKLLKAMGEGVTPMGGAPVVSVDDQAKGAIKAMSDVLAVRSGNAKEGMEGNPFRGSTLLDMAGQCLAKRGVSTAGMSKLDIVGSAFTHSSGDFSNILSNTANKSMLKGYDEVEETFDRFTSVGSLPDFKQATRVDLNEAPSLREVREGAEYKSVTFGDRGETVQLATYGELFSITRQAIINDDLSVFTRIPQKMGRAARRTVGDLAYAILTGNPAMSDGTTLFHSDHKNVATSAALSAANVDALRVLMATQKGAGGSANLNITPSFLLVPHALKSTALQLMASETDPSKNNSRLPNPVAGIAEVIADSRLDAASATTYYLLAGSMFDTIEIQYLDGNAAPMLEQQNGWNVDGVEFKVRIDAGAKALDHRTMARGTA